MVNAQEWINNKFSNLLDRIEIKSLSIFSKEGENLVDQHKQEYCFYKVLLEGELDLKDFDKLEYLSINGDSDDISRYQKITKIKCGKYRLNTLILKNVSENVEIDWPPKIPKLSGELWEETTRINYEKLEPRDLTTLVIDNCSGFKINNPYQKTIGVFSNLVNITISQCPQLTELDLKNNRELVRINLFSNKYLKELNITNLSKLEELNLEDCSSLVNLREIADYSSQLKAKKDEKKKEEKNKLEKKIQEQKRIKEEKLQWKKTTKELIEELPNQIKAKNYELKELIKLASKKVKLKYIEELLEIQKGVTIATLAKRKDKNKLEADLDCRQSWVRGKKELSQKEIDQICQVQIELTTLEEKLKELKRQEEKLTQEIWEMQEQIQQLNIK